MNADLISDKYIDVVSTESKHQKMPTVQQPTIAGFLIGLALMSVFAVAGVGGGPLAFSHISLKYQPKEKGRVIAGVVLSKRQIDSRAFPSASGHAYEITYRFSVDDLAFKGTSRVDRHVFFQWRHSSI